MPTSAGARRGPWDAIELNSSGLTVTLLPEKGCDVYELIDRASGIDLLLKTPWAPGRRTTVAADSFSGWIESYPGGWQVLLPNGGDAAIEHGVEWGFHGEAGRVQWQVDELTESGARCSTRLVTAPLMLRRVITVKDCELTVDETVENTSDSVVEVMWGHHPAFGPPFLEPGVTIATSARTFVTDERDPGTDLPAGTACDWPRVPLVSGGVADLSTLPPAGERRAVLGYLTDFLDGSYSLTNHRLGLEVEFRWPLELFPAAWFWQELRATPGFPWFRQIYTTAIEPNTSWPAHGIANLRAKGRRLLPLHPGTARHASLQIEVRRRSASHGE
ncbi:MAG: DUF4432 family protein [Conexibacteraceae bacterium]|nr:DUF4432 family protein [Conexibacteraceae bacterium]